MAPAPSRFVDMSPDSQFRRYERTRARDVRAAGVEDSRQRTGS